MVLQVVGALAAVVKVHYSSTVVDSITARIHYRWTSTCCLISAALLMAGSFIGDAIMCFGDDGDSANYINSFCWITSTYTINSTGNLQGLGRYDKEIHEKQVHSYYQWVPIVLAIQAGLFYLPHFIWKSVEGKQVDLLLQDINKSLFDEDAEKKVKNITAYLKESWGLNAKYFLGHFVCECLYLANVVFQMIMMDHFFDGAFMDYGTRVFNILRSDDEKKSSVFLEVFPRQTKCTFHKFGTSGDIKDEHVICILPQNILNEKIFLAMWLWFIVLMVITSLQLIWHLAVYASGFLRMKIMAYRLRTSTLSPRMEQALRNMPVGDFCLLNSTGMNLEPWYFQQVMDGVVKASEEVYEMYSASAPSYGTYNPLNNEDTMPRRRNIYPTLS